MPIIAGVASVVAVAALVALAVLLKRRRASRRKLLTPPLPPPTYDVNNLEHGGEEPQSRRPPPPSQPPSYSAMLALVGGDESSQFHQHDASRHRLMPAETVGVIGGDVARSSAPAALAARTGLSTERGMGAVEGVAARRAGEDAANSVATISTADASTGKRATSIASEPQLDKWLGRR